MKSSIPKAEKRIERKENKRQNILNYDSDNEYPQRILDIINSSGTAKRSVEVFMKFIIGGGFKDELFYKSTVNRKGLTADKLIRLSAFDYSHFGGVAYHINYNGLLQVYEVNHIPFEYCRLGIGDKSGKIAVYDDWELSKGKFEESRLKWYNRFSPNKETLIKQIEAVGGIHNFDGQIFYPEKYTLSPIDPIIEDVLSDKSIKAFTSKELRNGFNPSVIARHSKNFEGKEDELDELTGTYKEFQGEENTGKIFLLTGVEKDEFDLLRLESSGADKMYDLTDKRVKNSIIQRFGQPPSIVGKRDQNATFSSQNIEDDYKFYNSVTSDDRLYFEETMKLLFSNFHIKINGTNNWSILPLQFNAISTELPSKISQLGVGGTQALIDIVSNTSLNNVQKIAFLKSVFGFTLEESQEIILGI